VFGARAAAAIAAEPGDGQGAARPAPAIAQPPIAQDMGTRGDVPPFSRGALQELMWAHAGLVRDGAGLSRAAAVIGTWRSEARRVRSARRPGSVRRLEDENLLAVADAVVAAALTRTSSAGAHFRADGRAPSASAPVPDLIPTGAAC
jgi:L-aspartate oxidase